MKKEIEIVEKFIIENSLRYTPQRERMLKIFLLIERYLTPLRDKLQISGVCDKCAK